VPYDKLQIIWREVKEVQSGMTLNLSIGNPNLLSEHLDCSDVQIQAENGNWGWSYPEVGEEHHELVNPGRENVTLTEGASLVSSLAAFNMTKGG
jgi:acyl CoA:acetate/3-ketoacid CoA transferase beta subunit